MLVYRITLAKWANALVASGRAARWNSNGRFVIYTDSNRALACLENVVHRRSIGRDDLFRVMVIRIPDDLLIKEIKKEDMVQNWADYLNYAYCQRIGDEWLSRGSSAVLQIPSAIIPEEFNYLLNPQHPEFARITIQKTEPFVFDERLMNPERRK